jgi:hypothetical protein|tara:strand:- start:1196 stop:1396 length:201 start_codon:yes stop_codon:yes gene_type:complete
MRLIITFESSDEEDGFNGVTTVERNDIDDLQSLGQAYAEAARAAGFTYVEGVAFEKDDGQMVFGDF